MLSLILSWGMKSFAQADSSQTEKKKTTLTAGITYSNNASYYGQQAAEKMPYAAVSAMLKFPFGLYFTGMGYRLLHDSDAIVSASAAGIGFSFNLGKKLVADLNYSHTFYPAQSPFLQAASPDMAGASLSYEYWMTTAVNADYTFGKQQDVFVTLSTEKLIGLGHLFSKKDLVTLTPKIEVTAGTQHFYESYITEKYKRDSIMGFPLPPLIHLPGSSTTTTTTTTVDNSKFDMLSYNLRVPLAYNRAHYMIEAAWQLAVLSREAQTGGGTANSFFHLSMYYQF